MALVDDGHDPEWRVEGISWDVDTMEAGTKDNSSGGPTPSGRAINTSCQVEGCRAFLPARSYYQRQHICEEHFRAVTITEPSGRVTRFCQQCTKLEPLKNFDGERRSCRESLVRRNMRRQGRRGGNKRARPANKVPAAAAKPAAKRGGSAAAGPSGSGDSTAVQRASSPSGTTTASPGEPPISVQRDKRPRLEPAPSPSPVAAGYWLQPVPGLDSGSGSGSAAGSRCSPAGLPPHLLGAIEQLEALEPSMAAPALPAAAHASQLSQPTGPTAAGHPSQLLPGGLPGQPMHLQLLPGGAPGAVGAMQLTLTGMGQGELGSLAGMDVDHLLAIDSDQLADLLLAGSRTHPTAQAAPAAAAAAASHAGWALPELAPKQQALYQLPGMVAPQLQAPQLAGMAAALRPAGAHQLPLHASALQHPLAHAGSQLQPAGCKPADGNGSGSGSAGPDVAAFAASFFGDWPASSPADTELDALLDCFEPLYDEVRLSLKLYGVHPDQLPANLRAELLGALTLPLTPAQAAIRAGCVHLTLTALIDDEERRRLLAPGAAATVLARLLPLVQRLPAQRAALQLGQDGAGSAALLAAPRSGGPAALLSLQLGGEGSGSASLLPPALQLQPPLATTVSACRGFFRLCCPHGLLWGAGGLMALCRRAGTGHVPLSLALAGKLAPQPPQQGATEEEQGEETVPASDEELTSDEEAETAAEAECDPHELLEVDAWVPFQPPLVEERGSDTPLWQAGWGLYEFELARGTLVGPAVPVLVLPDAHAAAAAELASLPPGPRAATVLRLAALVLRYLEQREGATGPRAAAAFEARYPPLAVARLAAAARQLLSLAQRAGWSAVAPLVQPAAIADGWHPARAALMAAPQLAVVGAVPAAAEQPPAASPAPASPPPAQQPVAEAEHAAAEQAETVHVVGTLLPAPALAAQPAAHAEASGSGDSPHKPGGGSSSPWAGKAAAGDGKELEAQLSEVSERDRLRRVMHPAVLCAASLVVAGCVMGVGWALGAGYL
ncbi:squamosa promoter binding [Chlorella sorokiniana]|uniref:Squamosa promoter binding n=1 Tax=Chlorella sorokiniana TaxID=3076 RepID=A0A2P6TUZ9_CHLSO|nr:squamosa promoter binding [Chlorella sorokiniana]|eukprot:PRW57874.1 squamosa promoter binding [Chlorella sorokiniana]